MDIFGADHDQKLIEYKAKQQLFSVIKNSTSCVDGNLSGVSFHEEDFTACLDPNLAIHGSARVVIVDSNYGKFIRDGYTGLVKKPKSNRGRKPKQKEKTGRKVQGNGSKFNSCIQFTVLGTVPPIDDMEERIKEYKIKLFRNGKFQIPGVLTEDMSDAKNPLDDLIEYLDAYFLEPIQLIRLVPVMRNYKFHLLDGMIDIRKLYRYCLQNHTVLRNISMNDLKNFLLHPVFKIGEYHPHDQSWYNIIDLYSEIDGLIGPDELVSDTAVSERFELDVDELENELLWSKTTIKDVFVTVSKFKQLVVTINTKLNVVYNKFLLYMKTLVSGYVKLPERAMCTILELLLRPHFESLRNSVVNHPDNMMAGLKLNPEKYPGLLLYIKTPMPDKPSKRTTVKIFPSGKINIDGANNITEATHIYWWLNSILVDHPEFRYGSNFVHDASDSDFSEGE